MTADTLKTTRVLELYQDFLSGKLINKQKSVGAGNRISKAERPSNRKTDC